MSRQVHELAKRIDHAILKATVTREEVQKACAMAVLLDIAAVFVKPCDLEQAVRGLKGSSVLPGAVVGFPHGDLTTATKVFQTEESLRLGAEEVDMVCNVGWALSGAWDEVYEDIKEVAAVTHEQGNCLKVIFETCFLSTEQKVRLCEICAHIGVEYVKTSTGFGPNGAQLEDVVLFRKHLPDSVKIKASAGIRDLDTALSFLDAGADRLGTSATETLVKDLRRRYSSTATHGS